jgi:hypothetical protein
MALLDFRLSYVSSGISAWPGSSGAGIGTTLIPAARTSPARNKASLSWPASRRLLSGRVLQARKRNAARVVLVRPEGFGFERGIPCRIVPPVEAGIRRYKSSSSAIGPAPGSSAMQASFLYSCSEWRQTSLPSCTRYDSMDPSLSSSMDQVRWATRHRKTTPASPLGTTPSGGSTSVSRSASATATDADSTSIAGASTPSSARSPGLLLQRDNCSRTRRH